MSSARIVCGAAALMLALASPSRSAAAPPRIAGALGAGAGLGEEAQRRGEMQLAAAFAAPGGPWSLGLLLTGSLEGYTGGFSCGTHASTSPDEVVPSIATTCLQPAAGLYALVGWSRAAGSDARVRVEAGPGAALLWLVPGEGGETRTDLRPAWRAQATALARMGEMLGGRWWLGLQAEVVALGAAAFTLRPSVAAVLEADVLD